MLERVVRRCDHTVDKKPVNYCVLKHLFLEVEQPKILPKNPGNAFSDALLISYQYLKVRPNFIKLDESIYGETVVIPTNDREIPGSIPGIYNVQIKITS